MSHCLHCDDETKVVRGQRRITTKTVWICDVCRAPVGRPSETKGRRAPRKNINRRK